MTALKKANPGPLGLLGFALTTALLQGAVTSITEGTTESLVYGTAIAFGGLAQALAGIFEFQRGTTLPAVAFVCYGAFWISFAVNGIFAAAVLLSLWGILTFAFFAASLTLNLCLQALFLLLAVVFFLLSGGVTNPSSHKAAGWIGLVVAGIAGYGAVALLLNEMYSKTVLPLGTCNPGSRVLPYFQRAIGAIPVLGKMYCMAVAKEDRLAGYSELREVPTSSPVAKAPAAAFHTAASPRLGVAASVV